jgi:hypothetical protein
LKTWWKDKTQAQIDQSETPKAIYESAFKNYSDHCLIESKGYP